MSKSHEYGYIMDGPTQAGGSNSGVFEVGNNDVVDLLNKNKFFFLEKLDSQKNILNDDIEFVKVDISNFDVSNLDVSNIQIDIKKFIK